MTDSPKTDRAARAFGGLTATAPVGDRTSRTMMQTMPLLLAGSIAAMTLTGPAQPAIAAPVIKPKGVAGTLKHAMHAANTALKSGAALVRSTATAPATYPVVAGDSISSIAARFGLSTASVLALNGLDWSTLIFPGQVLRLTTSGPIAEVTASIGDVTRYTIVSGDTISAVADRLGVSTESILSANGLGWDSIIYPGQTIVIPETTSTSANSTYTVVSGDTVWGIAERFGVSAQSILDANGLTRDSVIYPGNLLTIPSGGTSVSADAPALTGLDAEATAHAATIIAVGRELGVPDYGIIIALATAMQESTMRNLDWGDRDSVGLFQQRPSSGWGTVEQLTTPAYAARLFYGGPSNPNAGSTRGLLDIPGWESMALTDAAQAVQISAFPDAYAKWEASAREWFAALG